MPKVHRFSQPARISQFLCLGVALVLAGCGGSTPSWQAFHSPEAEFSADFPGQVTQPQGIEKSGTGGPQTYHFECLAPHGFAYEVTFIRQTNTDADITKRLKEAEERRWKPDDPKVTASHSRVSLGSFSGVEQVGQFDQPDHKEFKRWRNFYTPAGDYYVSVSSSTTADATGADVERFFNSFMIDSAK